ncbi:trypsin-like peptidase domain-containing protein [Streptomyces mangrovisoli]|uniref:Serine protease n=1 Tax=Streptomyces mangrovisoli TaxID=1428628 RepID=A0A1J4NKF4_9ACTN|nr:trypsin-like peptidase domain-containing protein [Streptomyces mangrovisoli]OIJ62736.1 hypothetical protein WN71_037975 [Streptomyces mangrovisoli]
MPGPSRSLVRVRDLAGRLRGAGFVADHDGTVVTAHEVVDGLAQLVLTTTAGRTCVVDAADAVTPLPALALALVRTVGLGAEPLPITVRPRTDTGTYVEIAAGGWREARVLGSRAVTYTATDRFHPVDDAVELAIGTTGRDALRLGGGAAGGPVLDARTGAVIATLGTALTSGDRDTGFAVPLRRAAGPCAAACGGGCDGCKGCAGGGGGGFGAFGCGGCGGCGGFGGAPEAPAHTAPAPCPLAALLGRNAATVAAYGADLNPAAVLELAAASAASDGPPGARATHPGPELVQRADIAEELARFLTGPAAVLGLVGAPGSGRTTELAVLAARRGRGPAPAPTLWLSGADLRDDDTSVADAVERTLGRAARVVATARGVAPGDLGDLAPDRLAHLARSAGRPLLILLDGPEEMPPGLAHRLPEWTRATASWLAAAGARLVVACRAEHWESAGAAFPPDLLHRPDTRLASAPPPTPPCVPLGDLRTAEARLARERYGLAPTDLHDRDARHPLALRLLAEVRAAAPEACESLPAPLARGDVLAAWLDLACLRVAVRLAPANGPHGTAVRRLAARVSGQVHEAARRSLGPGQGELDRAAFEALFPWGRAPRRLGGGSGWAYAVLAEGLFVPAGDGYRFAHEEFADWIQGMHLDLDGALRVLVHRPRTPEAAHPLPVPHHRIGPVVQALLHLGRQQGTAQLACRLEDLVDALDALDAPNVDPDPGSVSDPGSEPAPGSEPDPGSEPGAWWAVRLLAQTLVSVPDATPYTRVLRLLADRIVAWRDERRAVAGEFTPDFWEALPLPEADRLDLLRRLVRADGAPARADRAPRHLDTVARLLAAAPAAVQPCLVRWFDDERPLPATPHATVATAAQALLHTHRHGAPDDLTEALADSVHPRADELLAVLAEEEPSAVCRAVDRWARDERPARRSAAAVQGLRAAPHVRTGADRDLLRHAALALLARPGDDAVHSGALALLVRDPRTRDRHLPEALRRFAQGDPRVPADAVATALASHPEPVLDAFRDRLLLPDSRDALRTLADVATPALARRVAVFVREAARRRPETAGPVAAHVDRRLDQGPATRDVLHPLVTALLADGPEPLRAALGTVLAAAGAPASRPLRRELLDVLLAREQEPAVLDAVLRAAARPDDADARELVHHTARLLARTPAGAARLDRGLVDLARHVPGFAALMARWLTDTPGRWAVLVAPATRRTIEHLAGPRVPA